MCITQIMIKLLILQNYKESKLYIILFESSTLGVYVLEKPQQSNILTFP